VIGAAEEVGLSRRSVERALAERLNLPATPPVVGSLTWARSADGKAHVAEVLSLSKDEARVRFLRGGEHRVTLDELRPCAFIPGERVACLAHVGTVDLYRDRLRFRQAAGQAERRLGIHKNISGV